jgi:MIP family channel proteins
MNFAWGIDRTETGMAATGAKRAKVIDMRAVVAELVAMTLFVIIGCGVACGNGASDGATRLLVAFAFGMGILVLAYTIGHHSGGQINCAVTFTLVLGGQVPWYQGLANFLAQMIGSCLGAMFLCIVFPCEGDLTQTLGTNIVNVDTYGEGRALAGEIFGTFLLCYVVWETAVSSKSATNKSNACIAIGFAVFLAHLLLLPIDGCSINPTRSFGPAIVGKIRDCNAEASDKGLEHLWIMFVGPLVGAALAAALQYPFLMIREPKQTVTLVTPIADPEKPAEKPLEVKEAFAEPEKPLS